MVKRQAEFVAGRKLAQQALKQIGQGYDRPIAIGTIESTMACGDHGLDRHCDGWAVCAVLKAEHLSVGIDIEHRLAHQTASEVQAMIGTAQEWTLLAQQFDLASAVTLLFSAKESLFKALFPQVQIYLDFSDAQLIGLDGNQLTLRLSIDRKPLIPDADYKVHFVWQESRVISAIRQIKRVSEC